VIIVCRKERGFITIALHHIKTEHATIATFTGERRGNRLPVKGTCLRQVETILHKIVTGKLRGDLRSPSYQAETIAQDTEF